MATTSQTIPAQTRIDYAATLDGRSKAVILVGVLLGLLLAALDQTIVSTAMPRIVADLQGIDLLAWVSTAYLLASTAMVPIYGKLSDLYGRKIILLFGIVVFLIGSMLCGIAPTMLMLVVCRAIQGLGAAALTSTAFAVPADLFVPAERPRYQGIFMGVFGLSSVIGPFVGGLLTDGPGWRWVFYVNLPLGMIALAFIIAKMPRMHSGLRAPIDYQGAATLMLTVVPLLLALTLDKATHAWTSPLILGLFALALVGLVHRHRAARSRADHPAAAVSHSHLQPDHAGIANDRCVPVHCGAVPIAVPGECARRQRHLGRHHAHPAHGRHGDQLDRVVAGGAAVRAL
jgi:MFS family permease